VKLINNTKIKNTLHQSIIRRSVVFVCLLFIGFSLNYLVQYLSSRMLGVNDFGIFYESIAIVNLSTIPAIVFGMYFTRYVVNVENKDEIPLELTSYISTVKNKGARVLALFMFLLLIAWIANPFEAALLVAIILLTIYSSYLLEALKSVFEASNRVILTGVFTITTLFFRFIIGISFLFIGGTVWSGMLGIMTSGYLAFFLFNYYYVVDCTAEVEGSKSKFNITLRDTIWFSSSFFLASFIMYLDIIFAYFILPMGELGIYTASSVLPKGLLLFTLPLTKVLYPMIAGRKNNHGENYLINIVKMISIMFLISGLGTLFLLIFKELLVDGVLSINHINSEIFSLIIFSIIPLTLLRTLIAISLARGYNRSPSLLIFPVIFYISHLMLVEVSLLQFSNNFLIFSWIAFFYYIVVQILLYFFIYKRQKKGREL
jgi:O-antigen/teichoic acid export membrane protein